MQKTRKRMRMVDSIQHYCTEQGRQLVLKAWKDFILDKSGPSRKEGEEHRDCVSK
jgi:hypothetical protein